MLRWTVCKTVFPAVLLPPSNAPSHRPASWLLRIKRTNQGRTAVPNASVTFTRSIGEIRIPAD
jgi:hypothetical protein